jgi:hypothetical protein
MNFKKILAVLSVAGILSMSIVNCGGPSDPSLAVLKSGTYDCIDNKDVKSTLIFDTVKHTWDYIIKGEKISDDYKSIGTMFLDREDKDTQIYILAVKSTDNIDVLFALTANGTEFTMESRKFSGDDTVFTCTKK